MSITTYSELQTAVQNWLHRADTGLTNRIPEFIALCEAKFNRNLRLLTMETRNSSFAATAQYATLPTDFLELRSIRIMGDSGKQLEYMTPGDLRNRYRDSNTGIPKYYTIIGTQIEFAPIPSSSVAELIYYAAIPALSASSPTNWMLTNNPDVYLYGSLMEAAPFMKKNEDIMVWASLYKGAVKDVSDADQRSKYSGPLMMRVG